MTNVTTMFLSVQESETLEKIGRIAAKIAFYNFEWRYVTLVIFNNVQYVIALESFLSNYKQSVILKFGKFIPHRRYRIPQYVIFGQDAVTIVDMIKWMDESQYDNSGKYIFICTSPDYATCDESQIFVALSQVLIVNVVYLKAYNNEDFRSFSYEIVLSGKCINSQPYILNVTENCIHDDCLKELYPEKLKNFNRCPLIISTFEQPPFIYLNNVTMEPSGEDGDIIKLVASVLNATLVVRTPNEGNDWGDFENNTWTGSLGDVYNDRAHLSVGSLPLTANKYGNFQISFIYNSMDVIWIAELPASKPVWQKLLNPLQTDLRVALFFIFVGIVIVNAFTKSSVWRKFRNVVNIGRFQSNLLFYSWALFLGIPILRMPAKRALLFIVYSWIWFCFIVKSAYQATLISSLKNQMYEKFLSDFENALRLKYPYGGLRLFREYYVDDPYVYKNWITLDIDDATKTLDRICNENSDFVLAINKEIVIEHLIKHNGLRHLQIIPEKIVNSPTVMYFKKHSVIIQPFNYVLSISVEAGLTQLTYKRYLRDKKLLFQRLDNERNSPLTFNNFRACMILLVFGWSISVLFFAAEAYCGRLESD